MVCCVIAVYGLLPLLDFNVAYEVHLVLCLPEPAAPLSSEGDWIGLSAPLKLINHIFMKLSQIWRLEILELASCEHLKKNKKKKTIFPLCDFYTCCIVQHVLKHRVLLGGWGAAKWEIITGCGLRGGGDAWSFWIASGEHLSGHFLDALLARPAFLHPPLLEHISDTSPLVMLMEQFGCSFLAGPMQVWIKQPVRRLFFTRSSENLDQINLFRLARRLGEKLLKQSAAAICRRFELILSPHHKSDASISVIAFMGFQDFTFWKKTQTFFILPNQVFLWFNCMHPLPSFFVLFCCLSCFFISSGMKVLLAFNYIFFLEP